MGATIAGSLILKELVGMRLNIYFIMAAFFTSAPVLAIPIYFECTTVEDPSPLRTIQVDFRDLESFTPASWGASDHRTQQVMNEGVRRTNQALAGRATSFEDREIRSPHTFWDSHAGKTVLKWIEEPDYQLHLAFTFIDCEADVENVRRIMEFLTHQGGLDSVIDDFFIVEETHKEDKHSLLMEPLNEQYERESHFFTRFKTATISCTGESKALASEKITEELNKWPKPVRKTMNIKSDSSS